MRCQRGVDVARVELADAALSGERREHLAQGRRSDSARFAERGDRERAGRVGQRAHHALGDGKRFWARPGSIRLRLTARPVSSRHSLLVTPEALESGCDGLVCRDTSNQEQTR